MAVTAFSPGAQVVKDKELHTAVGFYVPSSSSQGKPQCGEDHLLGPPTAGIRLRGS